MIITSTIKGATARVVRKPSLRDVHNAKNTAAAEALVAKLAAARVADATKLAK